MRDLKYTHHGETKDFSIGVPGCYYNSKLEEGDLVYLDVASYQLFIVNTSTKKHIAHSLRDIFGEFAEKIEKAKRCVF